MLRLRMPPRPERYIDPKGVFMLYTMLKNHMNGKYDVIKYNWRIKVSDAAFNKRRDKYFFTNLSQKYTLGELVHLFVSNLLMNQNTWIGEISDSDALVFYREHKGRLLRMREIFADDVKSIYYFSKKMNCTLNEIFEYNPSTSTSYIFKLLQSQLISTETFILLDSFLGIINKHDQVNNDLIWSTYSTKLNAFKKIVYTDSVEARQLFIKTVKDSKY